MRTEWNNDNWKRESKKVISVKCTDTKQQNREGKNGHAGFFALVEYIDAGVLRDGYLLV